MVTFNAVAPCHPLRSIKKKGSSPYPGPPQLVQVVIDHFGMGHLIVQESSLQGLGFILYWISPTYLQFTVQTLVSNQARLPKPTIASQQYVVDFSSYNIAKEMWSMIIGEAVCCVLEFVGHKVERVNHVGDWGTQFRMLIQFLKEAFPNFSSSVPNITHLTTFYKSAKEQFDVNADLKKTSQLNVVKFQSGDEECLKVWKTLCNASCQ
jgi:arginyl-tRNA synthetase